MRTALINQLRGVLLERGLTFPQGRRKLELRLETMMAEEAVSLSSGTRLLINDMRTEWRELDGRIAAFDNEFAAQARSNEAARLLTTIPGIGIVNAAALTAAIDSGQRPGGLDLSAWLGLVPKQMTTGGRPRLLGISKRGNVVVVALASKLARIVWAVLRTGQAFEMRVAAAAG